MIGYNQHVYKMQSDFSITESLTGYDSVGCGAQLALGAFYAQLQNEKLLDLSDTETILKTALGAAACFSIVSPPFHIIKLAHNTGRNT